ncbi:MAG: FMN-binding protein [Cyclobacteriaceae bacterium]|nr:FMN-binding protein [Cyclobacteriaceae bacterium]
MKKLFLLLSITVISLSAFIVVENQLPKSAWKKINKEIAKLWPDIEVEKEQIKDDEYQLFKLNNGEKLQGYMFLSKAPSRYDHFDYMLIYTPELNIKSAQILVYRESYGGEIGSVRWLKQFIGLNKQNTFELGEDIQGISGATVSCQAATKGFKKSTIIMNKLKDEGAI